MVTTLFLCVNAQTEYCFIYSWWIVQFNSRTRFFFFVCVNLRLQNVHRLKCSGAVSVFYCRPHGSRWPRAEKVQKEAEAQILQVLIPTQHSSVHSNSGPAVRRQVEFYFSNSNMYKSTYMQQQVANDPDGCVYPTWEGLTPFTDVPLTTILSFNKIQLLNATQQDLQCAIEKSTSLILSKDRHKVRRANPLPPINKTEEIRKTVYVVCIHSLLIISLCLLYQSNIGPTVGRDEIANLFSKFGEITFISIPTTESGGQRVNKGFAFVEFRTEAGATKAIDINLLDTEPSVEGGLVGTIIVIPKYDVCFLRNWIRRQEWLNSLPNSRTLSEDRGPRRKSGDKAHNENRTGVRAIQYRPSKKEEKHYKSRRENYAVGKEPDNYASPPATNKIQIISGTIVKLGSLDPSIKKHELRVNNSLYVD